MNAEPNFKETPFTPEGPQPLLREIPPGQPFPVGALGPLRDAVEAVQGMTQAPVAIPAASALAVASLAVQGFADVETLGGIRPTSLYLLTIAQSGERKSSCDKPLMQALRDHEREQADAYSAAFKKWQADMDLYDAQKKGMLRDVTSQNPEKSMGAKADLAALGDPPDGPVLPDRTASEPTLEGLFRAFLQGQPSLGLFSDEAGQFLGGHGMNADNRMKTLGGLNLLWDGAEIKRTRAGDGVYTLRGRRGALHLMAQPVVMHGFLADPLAAGLGFLPRCLICEPLSTIGTRLSQNAVQDEMALAAFGSRLKSFLSREMPTWEDGRSLKPRLLRLSSDAKALLVEFSDAIESQQAPRAALAHITGTASKAAEQAARIAGVLTLWADLDAAEIDVQGMEWGIELACFYLGEASRLASAATVSEEIGRSEALKKWLLETWAHAEIASSEILQLGPHAMRDAPKVKKATALLTDHGWLLALEEGTVVRGKARKSAWRIVRGAADVL